MSGTVTEDSISLTPGSQPWSIVPGPGGAPQFTECNAAKIGRITIGGEITEYDVDRFIL